MESPSPYRAPGQDAFAPAGAQQYRLRLSKQTGIIVLWRRTTQVYSGTFDQLATRYEEVKRFNLMYGWWSIISVVMNPITLNSNAQAFKKLRQLAGR